MVVSKEQLSRLHHSSPSETAPQKIKVLWFVTPFNCSQIVGGTLGRLLKWYRAINHSRFDVRILISGPNAESLKSLKVAYAKNGVEIDVIPELTLMGMLRRRTRIAFHNYVKSGDFDVIHTLFIQADLIAALLRPRVGCKRLMSSLEGALYPRGGAKELLYGALYRVLRRRLDVVIALCHFTRQQAVEEYGVLSSCCRVIYSGIDSSRFRFPHVIRASTEPMTIGFLGSIDSGKRIDLFIDAIPRLIRRNSKLRFVVGGIGKDMKRIVSKVHALEIDRYVEFRGFVKDVPLFFEEIDVYLFLSEREGLPWVVLEAQAAGVPTIASAVGGVPEVIEDGNNGTLLESATINNLCNKVEALISDVALREAFSANGRAVVESRFDARREMQEIEAIYDSQ